MADKRPQQH